MSDNFNKTGIGIDDNNGLPTLDDMYKPPKKDDMGYSQPSGLPPLNPEKKEAAYYADGSIPPFFGQSRDNGGQPNGLPPLNSQPKPGNGNVPQGNVPPQYAQPYNAPPQYIQAYATRTFSKEDMLVEGGRKIAKVVGIIIIVCAVLTLISNTVLFVDQDKGNAYALWQFFKHAAVQGGFIYFSVCFMKGGNKSRIFLGVVYLLALLAVIALVVLLVSGAGVIFGADLGLFIGVGMGVMLISMMPFIALTGFIIWGTLISKKVKAYCGVLE